MQPAVEPSNIRRRLTNQFVEIDETEYSTVSDFVKQRVKLSEVNIVSLWHLNWVEWSFAVQVQCIHILLLKQVLHIVLSLSKLSRKID